MKREETEQRETQWPVDATLAPETQREKNNVQMEDLMKEGDRAAQEDWRSHVLKGKKQVLVTF